MNVYLIVSFGNVFKIYILYKIILSFFADTEFREYSFANNRNFTLKKRRKFQYFLPLKSTRPKVSSNENFIPKS